MITTHKINVKLGKGRRKLVQISTKDVDASFKFKLPKKPIKPVGISTRTLADVADIAKKRWKEMTDAEKKIEVKRRTAKMKATKARKKKEKENKNEKK